MKPKINTKNLYSGLDLFKFIAACLIVLIHATETKDVFATGVVYIFTRFSVPFFFIASGFLFHEGINRVTRPSIYFISYMNKLIVIFTFWGVLVYGFLTVRDYLVEMDSNDTIDIVVLSFRRIMIIGAGPIWYILSLIISIAIIYICYRVSKEQLIILFCVITFLINMLYNNVEVIQSGDTWISCFKDLNDFVFSNSNNFILSGVPFVGLGYIVSWFNIRISNRISIILFVTFTIARFVEYCFLVRFGKSVSISFIFQAFFFFMIAINISKSYKYSNEMRNASTVVYLLHWLILYEILNPIMRGLGINPYQVWLIPLKVAIVVGVCLVLFIIARKIDNKYINVVLGM